MPDRPNCKNWPWAHLEEWISWSWLNRLLFLVCWYPMMIQPALLTLSLNYTSIIAELKMNLSGFQKEPLLCCWPWRWTNLMTFISLPTNAKPHFSLELLNLPVNNLSWNNPPDLPSSPLPILPPSFLPVIGLKRLKGAELLCGEFNFKDPELLDSLRVAEEGRRRRRRKGGRCLVL